MIHKIPKKELFHSLLNLIKVNLKLFYQFNQNPSPIHLIKKYPIINYHSLRF